jgi:hypothetical protein
MDDKEPPTRRLVLKPKEVVPTDTVSRPGDGTAISVRLMHATNRVAEEKGRIAEAASSDFGWEGLPRKAAAGPDEPGAAPVFKLKEIEPTDPPSFPGDESAISVHGMLQRNRRAVAESVPELIAMPPRRSSKRHRDFALVIGVAALAFGSLALVFRHDLQIVGLAAFAIVFTTAILAWVIYGVMDHY